MSDIFEVARSAGNLKTLGAVGRSAIESLKEMLGERISAALRSRDLTVRAAEAATGFAAADFSRIRKGRLARFTVDRLMAILGELDPTIEMSVLVRPKLRRAWVIDQLKQREMEIRAHGVDGLFLFGSVARDDAGTESDVDLLVDADPSRFKQTDTLTLKLALEESLGVPVHVVERQNLKDRMRPAIEREAQRVLLTCHGTSV